MRTRPIWFVALFAVSCAHAPAAPAPAAPPAASIGLDLAGVDRAVAPGDDFYAYANGAWMKTAQIPPDRASWGPWGALAELTDQRVKAIITDPALERAAPGTNERKIADLYASFMDEAGIEAKGLAPLQPRLAALGAIADAKGLARALGAQLRADVDALNNTNFHTDNLFGLWVAQDLDAPARYAAFLMQGGLELPDRDYYLDPSPKMEEIRGQYRAHIAAVLRLAGHAKPEEEAARIYDLEVRIAKAHASRLDSEDVKKGDNHWPRAAFAKRAPGLDWDAFFDAAGLGGQPELVVWQPGAVTGISALVKSQPLATWKEWLAFHALERAAPCLPRAFVEESFAFYGRTLSGTPKNRERWKRAVERVNGAMGMAVGKLYVEKYFPPAEKARAEAMVKQLLAAFGKRIDGLAWMAPETKARAKAKLAALRVYVGYPDAWRDYSGLEIVRGDALGNAQRAHLFELRRNLAKLGRPVDRGEWVMNPQLVNAVNLPAMNALNFPAAMLQPPYFDPSRPPVMDYGATGAIIGHEVSHSFDDQGALFDAEGRLHNWWTPADFAHFEASGAALAKQFDAYAPFPDLHVRGKQTLSENIADVAGLAAAYDAYRSSEGGKEAPAVAGLTGDQQFFLSFGQSWRARVREAALRRQILTDGHAPDEYRADTVRNEDAWYPAFGVQPGQRLYLAPGERVHVW